MNIAKIQAAFQVDGWQWNEQIFNDGKPECMIEFTRDISPHALSTFPRPLDCVGWGRFDRDYAWFQAGEWLEKKKVACVRVERNHGCTKQNIRLFFTKGLSWL